MSQDSRLNGPRAVCVCVYYINMRKKQKENVFRLKFEIRARFSENIFTRRPKLSIGILCVRTLRLHDATFRLYLRCLHRTNFRPCTSRLQKYARTRARTLQVA